MDLPGSGFRSRLQSQCAVGRIVRVPIAAIQQFPWQWVWSFRARLDQVSRLLFPFFDMYWFDTLPKLAEDKFPRFEDLKEKYWVLFTLGTRLADRDRKQISIAITAANESVFEPFIKLGITTYRQFFDILLAMADVATLEFCSLFEITPEQLRSL